MSTRKPTVQFSLAPIHTLHWLFFFNDTATTEIYTLSLHDALPICKPTKTGVTLVNRTKIEVFTASFRTVRSEEHTSELQSRLHLVCRLLLEKKKKEIGISRDTILECARQRH